MRLDDESIYAPGVDVIELRKRMAWSSRNPIPSRCRSTRTSSTRCASTASATAACWTRSASAACAAPRLWDEAKDRLHQSGLGLSGGQQQRLCIARAIAAEPEVLLMDEPCSALDPIATGRIEDLIAELKGHYTVLIVTHNMQQASRTSDFTAFMYRGRLIEYGPTYDMFTHPHRAETEDYISGRFG